MSDEFPTYRAARKVLKALNQVALPGQIVPSDVVATRLNVSHLVVEDHARYLASIGLLKYDKSKTDYYASLSPTDAGSKYFVLSADRVRQFMYKSVAVPVLVSLLTSLVLHWLFG
jgi:RIO-like serine/threonine protein kinase